MSINLDIMVISVAFGLAFASFVGLILTLNAHSTPRYSLDRLAAHDTAPAHRSIFNIPAILGSVPIPEDTTRWLGQSGAEKRLLAAGSPWGLDAATYVRFKVVVVLLNALLFMILALSGLIIPGGAMVFFVITGLLFWLLSDWNLARLRQIRIDKLNRAVPDLADLLAVSVEGGLNLNSAFRSVVKRFPDPLGSELRNALVQMDYGMDIGSALREIVERTSAEEVGQFVRPFLQAAAQGGGFADNLRNLAEDMRERRKQRAQERGRRAATQVLAPMMFCIFPALLIVVVGPALMSFLSSFSGR